MNRIDLAKVRLLKEEGKRAFAYNDATGKRVTCKPNGNLTIAVGVNLETGLDDEEIDWLFTHRLTVIDKRLSAVPFYPKLDEPRGSVFLDIAYNQGVVGMLHFHKCITAASIGDWGVAHIEVMESDAARADPNRYQPLAEILLTGVP